MNANHQEQIQNLTASHQDQIQNLKTSHQEQIDAMSANHQEKTSHQDLWMPNHALVADVAVRLLDAIQMFMSSVRESDAGFNQESLRCSDRQLVKYKCFLSLKAAFGGFQRQ